MTEEEFFGHFGEIEKVDFSKFQQIVAKRLTQSWNTIPHVTHDDVADVTALDAYRKAMSPEDKVSPLIFIIKALVSGLKTFPTFNSSLSQDGKTLIMKKYFHVGIAVDGPLGLLVPVLRDADQKDLQTLAKELKAFSVRARDKGLPMDDMQGGCMTITSLGGIGGTSFTPIINPPDVAILGVTPTRTVAGWNGEGFEPRQHMTLSLSYDHRVINGADAARFTRHVAEALADPEKLAAS